MNLDHIDGLDDAGGEHTGGTAIDEGLHRGPDSGGFGLLLVSHNFFFCTQKRVRAQAGEREREEIG